MNSIWDVTFCVVDVETTGSNAEKNRVFDIACLSVENGEIVSEYSSLVNPHQFIPPFISKMTGVTNEKVYNAPEPIIVFQQIEKILFVKPVIFVAHNAGFDYSFLQESMKRMGVKLELPVLCTLKLARRLLPKNLKKNVGSLADFFGHKIRSRHRAYDDTLATVIILNELLEIAEEEYDIETIDELLSFQNRAIKHFKSSPPALKRIEEKIAELPNSPGVYYFLGKEGKILYIGKSKSLKERVGSYFSNSEHSSRKISDLIKKVYDLRWEPLDTELDALLLESAEIKKHKPYFNSVQKKYRRYPFIRITNEEYPIAMLSRGNDDIDGMLFGPFRSAAFVNEILVEIEKKFKLRKCTKKINPDLFAKPCFYHHIHKCLAPCAALCDKTEYMKEVERVKYFLSGFSDGIIEQLEKKMQEYSDKLEFEKANLIKFQIHELRKTFFTSGNIGKSLNDNSFVVLDLNIDKTIDMFFIRSGKYFECYTIGIKAPKEMLMSKIHDIYFNGAQSNNNLTLEDIDEIRIVSSYLYKNHRDSTYIHIDSKNEEQLCEEISSVIEEIAAEFNSSEDVFFDDITVDFFND